ncbi:MAG: hypothetical protein JRI28_06320 [Deltaproteobacteria bacterium]|nr:hypothetical protein [Deltaproteobacteria bacterium]
MGLKSKKVVLTTLMIILIASTSYGFELKTRYTTIIYDDQKQLRKFDDKLYLGRLRYLLRKRKDITVAEAVKNKVDLITEKVETVLEMFPNPLKFTLVLLSTPRDVQNAYQKIYGRKVNYIAFYSPKENTVFISVKRAKLRVLAHEFGHVVVENYFEVSPPAKIHEVLAQFAETHITD